MLSRIFKNSDRLIFVILPFLGLIAWIFLFFVIGYSKAEFPSSVLFSFAPAFLYQAWLMKLLNLLLMIGGALLVNYFTQYHEVTEKQNYLPSFIYLLLSGMLTSQSMLHPLLVANILILFAFLRFFSAYRSDNALSVAFDASFMLSCAILVYWPVLLLTPVCFIALMIIKTIRIREVLLIIMGLALPFVITAALLWIFNVEWTFWKQSFDAAFVPFHLPEWPKGSFLVNTASLLLLLLSFTGMMVHGFGSKVKTQKIKYVLIWMMLPGALAVFFSSGTPVFVGIVTIIPFSLFTGDYLGNIKKSAVADFLILVFVAAFVFSNLQTAGIL